MELQKPVSLLMFSNTPVRAGAEEHILALLRHLDRRVFAPTLVCTPELAELLKGDVPAETIVSPIRLASPTDVVGALRFFKIITDRKPKIVHSHMFQASMYASPLSRLAKVPVTIETTHVREQWRKGLKAYYGPDRLIGRAVDHYIAISHANARYLREVKGIPAEKISVVQNGIDLSHYSAEPAAICALRKEYGFTDRHRLLVVAARLEEQKGHRYLLESFRIIHSQYADARLVIVGDGKLRRSLEEQARSLGLQNFVCFTGFQLNIPEWLGAAEVVVLPSLYEGLPLSAIEALAACKPLVATSVDGTPEIVLHEQTGLLVPPADPLELASGICRLLSNPDYARQLARAGHELALQKFSLELQIRKTMQVYANCLRQKTGLELRWDNDIEAHAADHGV